VDEVAPAPVDERAVGMPSSTQRKMCLEAGSASPDLRLEAGIVVHRNTSVYININQVDRTLDLLRPRRSGTLDYEQQAQFHFRSRN
jgi:hypothetical protein